jgi:hypothetical protein
MTYGVDGVRAMMLEGKGLEDIGLNIGVLAAYTVGMLILASFTLRRGSSG